MVGCLQYPNPISYYTIRYYIEYGQYGRYYTIHVQYIYIYTYVYVYMWYFNIKKWYQCIWHVIFCTILYHFYMFAWNQHAPACSNLGHTWRQHGIEDVSKVFELPCTCHEFFGNKGCSGANTEWKMGKLDPLNWKLRSNSKKKLPLYECWI